MYFSFLNHYYFGSVLISTDLPVFQSLFTCRGALVEEEVEYLNAAEQGDLAAVQKAIHEANVNINCLDHMGRSALELALIHDQVNALIELGNALIKPGNALINDQVMHL